MKLGLQELEKALNENHDRIIEHSSDFNKIFLWLAGYIRTVSSSNDFNKKGEDLSVPLEKTLNIAIQLFSMIDKGNRGLDDKIAEDLKEIKNKYFGMRS